VTEIAPEGQGNLEGAQGLPEGQPVDTGTPSINPAWTELLGVVPSQLHSQVTPHLQKWDQNFQTKINEVHSQYEPWKQFIDNGVAPDDVQYSLGLLQALSENPQEVIKALNEWAGLENGTNPEQQGQFNQSQQPGQEEDDPILSHPKVQEMQKGLETLAQIILSQRESEQQSAADKELETDLAALKEAHGDFDEELVLALAMQGERFDYAALESAVKRVVESTKPPARQPGPPVLGNGAAPPADIPKPQNDAERRNLVAQMLAQAQRQQ
jgi:hypothetical protein